MPAIVTHGQKGAPLGHWLNTREPGPEGDPPCNERPTLRHAVGVTPGGKWRWRDGPSPAPKGKRG